MVPKSSFDFRSTPTLETRQVCHFGIQLQLSSLTDHAKHKHLQVFTSPQTYSAIFLHFNRSVFIMTGHNDDISPDVSSCRYRKRISPLYDPHT
jgi:hypothetical protein